MIKNYFNNSFDPHNENNSIAGIYRKARILSFILISISTLLALYIIIGLLYLYMKSEAVIYVKVFITIISIIVAFVVFVGFEVGELLYNYSNKLKYLLDTYVRLYMKYADDIIVNRKIFMNLSIHKKRIYAEKFCKEHKLD